MSISRIALAHEVRRFEAEVRGLAVELARSILLRELERARPPVIASQAESARLAGRPESAPSRSRGWTREAVISELGAMLLTGRPVEAADLKRHGPRGLAAAAKKLFGRFDAALNAANLAIAGQVEAKRRPADAGPRGLRASAHGTFTARASGR